MEIVEKKKCLIIVCGLRIGGVETYVSRLAESMAKRGVSPVVLVLSRKHDAAILARIERCSQVIWIDEVQAFPGATSWLNAFIPLKARSTLLDQVYDYVHVVDSLTLHFLALNAHLIRYRSATIGIYHEREFLWWSGANVMFRRQQIALARLNARAILFPNEVIRTRFAGDNALAEQDLPLLPLGVDLPHLGILASQPSLRIVSIGRLVDFKTYNRIVIDVLPRLRESGNFRYEIYGSGPAGAALRQQVADLGLEAHVDFRGDIAPQDIEGALRGAFCFVGSGTTVITSASYGVPSLVGVESNPALTTGGLFSEVSGYSYNEASCYTALKPMLDELLALHRASPDEYNAISMRHLRKSEEFDIDQTVVQFLDSFHGPLQLVPLRSRWAAAASVVTSLIPLAGPGIASFKRRYFNG